MQVRSTEGLGRQGFYRGVGAACFGVGGGLTNTMVKFSTTPSSRFQEGTRSSHSASP